MQSQQMHPDHEDSDELDPENAEPSKSQRKRDADEIRDFARLLTTLPPRKLKQLSLPAEINEAIKACPPASTRGAHKRHLMFISKLMRKTEQVDEWRAQLESPVSRNPDHSHEIMRDNLVNAFADQVDQLREHYPQANLQKIRQLVRQINAAAEPAEDANEEQKQAFAALKKKADKAKKSLLQLLKENATSA